MKEQFTAVHTAIDDVQFDGETVLRLEREASFKENDYTSYAKLNDVKFHNGVIEVKMLSRLLPDAPDFARGFIGVVFRTAEKDCEFEGFYLRPANGRIDDPIRRSHACQYFAYPGYDFAYFRNYELAGYEAPADIGLDEWISVKIVVKDDDAALYINGSAEPALAIKMKHNAAARGGVGLFANLGTEGFFKDWVVICED